MGGRGAFGPNYGGGSSGELDRLRAPYGFVPLSGVVVVPDHGRSVPKDQRFADVPFEDGVCGSLELELTCHTPLFVRGVKARNEPFRLADDTWAIPGSSLRGMMRNVVEIATFSRMDRVNDHRYGVRDLQNPELYGRKMATIARAPNGKQETVPLVSAGWLHFDPEKDPYDTDGDDDEVVATVVPCSFAKVHYRILMEHAKAVGVHGFQPGARQSSVRKYETWGASPREVSASVVEVLRGDGPKGEPRWGSFGKVHRLAPGRTGTLVFTGQPNAWVDGNPDHKRRKQHDFVFFGPLDVRLAVTRRVFREFQFIHSDSGEQHGLGYEPNKEWGYWKGLLDRSKSAKMPVFFLPEPKDRRLVASFGLAMMFRLPYRHTTKDLVEQAQLGEGGRPDARDLATLLFGDVPPRGRAGRGKEHEGLRGRVRFGLARCVTTPLPTLLDEVRTVLGTPKASYYPSYVEQDLDRGPGSRPPRGADGKPRWMTYMDGDDAPKARPRGWKRYRAVTSTARASLPTDKDTSGVETRFRPLPAGTRFRFTVDVHNLRPEELGALVWAIDFGGRKELRHTLGLARPLGYGSVSLAIVREHLEWNDLGRSGTPDLVALRGEFVSFMDGHFAKRGIPHTWQESRELHELLALATPISGTEREDIRHMLLNHPAYRNEFVAAKRTGLALEAAGAKTWNGSPRLTTAPRPANGAPQPTGPRPPAAPPSTAAPPPKNEEAAPAPDGTSGTPPTEEQLLLLHLRDLGPGNATQLSQALLQRTAHDPALQKRVAREMVNRLTPKWLKNRNKAWADDLLRLAE